MNKRAKGKYLTILSGKFCQSYKEPNENTVTRVNKKGNTVYEEFFDDINGRLTGISIKEDTGYGKQWMFRLEDDEGEVMNLQLPYSNSYAVAFLKMLPNIDLEKEMVLTPSQKVVDGKTQSALFIRQDDQPIKHAYNKENPNGMPDMVKIKVKGKETWDDSDRLEFLLEMVNTTILPKLNQKPIEKAEAAGPTLDEVAEGDSEDVPF